MQKIILRYIAAFIFLFSIHNTAFAAEIFDRFYFFGDSLTDMGNFQGGTPTTAQKAPITSGDSTWANYFARHFSASASPSSDGGNDYAFAGAETGASLIDGTIPDPGVIGQVRHYLNTQRVDAKALYSIWAGANDINNQLATTPVMTVIGNSVNNINSIVQMLSGAGARYIMVFNLPDLGKTPKGEALGPVISAELSGVTQAYNHVLSSTLNANNFNIIQVDVYSLLQDALINPAHFGFSNVSDPCAIKDSSGTVTSVCANPDQYLFWDQEHPTDAAHRMIADYAYSIVTGPTRAAILAIAPISVMTSHNNAIESQLYTLRSGIASLNVGGTSLFSSSSYLPSLQNTGGANAHAADVNIGIIHRLNNYFSDGASVAYSRGQINFGQHAGGFDMAETIASLFGGFHYRQFYADALASYGVINYSNINRNIPIGISQNSTSAKTTGSDLDGNLIVGYNLIEQAELQTGPLANIDYQQVRVHAYSEKGSIGGIAEQFDNQLNTSLTTGIGWQIASTFDLNHKAVMPFAQLSYNHQWYNGDREVRAGLVSLPGSHFSIPVHTPNKNFGLASMGFAINLAKSLTLNLGYSSTFLGAGHQSQNANISMQMAL